MSTRVCRFQHVAAFTEAVDFVGDFCVIDGNINCTTIKLRNTSFSGAFSLTCTTLTCDHETFKSLIAASVVLTGVTTFVPNFPRFQLLFGASTASAGQFMLIGGPTAVSTTTEASGQVQMVNSYALIGMTGRAIAQPCTLTVRQGGVSKSMTCAPAAGGNDKDYAIGHWVTGNQYDLIGMQVGGTGGGLARGAIEGTWL